MQGKQNIHCFEVCSCHGWKWHMTDTGLCSWAEKSKINDFDIENKEVKKIGGTCDKADSEKVGVQYFPRDEI